MDRNNCLVCSISLLAEALGKSTKTISRSIKVLKDNNYIFTFKIGSLNSYHLNSDICWKAWVTGKAYAKYSGTILLSKSKKYQHRKKSDNNYHCLMSTHLRGYSLCSI